MGTFPRRPPWRPRFFNAAEEAPMFLEAVRNDLAWWRRNIWWWIRDAIEWGTPVRFPRSVVGIDPRAVDDALKAAYPEDKVKQMLFGESPLFEMLR
jgi:hypothetical protein